MSPIDTQAAGVTRVRRLLALVPCVVGLGALIGWYTDIESLRTVIPGYASMKPHTALALICVGVAIMLGRPGVSRLLGGFAATLATMALVGYAIGRPAIRSDQLLPGIDLGGELPRMAPATAVGLILLALALLVSQRHVWSDVLSMGAFAVGYVATLGHAYGVSDLYAVGGYTSMAVHTAVSLCLLAVARLLQEPERGVVGALRDPGSAGSMMRTLLPFLIIGPAVLGGLRLWGQSAGLFDTSFGVALLVMSMTLGGLAVTWRAAAQVRTMEAGRTRTAAALVDLNRTLERTVQERTAELNGVANRLTALIEVAPVGIVELDRQGNVLASNARWETLSGLSESRARGTGWISALHPDDAERVPAQWAERAAAGLPYETTIRFLLPDGRVNWVQGVTTPLIDHGVVTGHLGAVVDITELRRAETEAAEASARFRAAFESSPLGAALTTPDGRIIEVNRQLCDFTDLPPEHLQGGRVAELFRSEDVTHDDSWLVPLLEGDLGSHHMERRLQGAGSEETWVRVSVGLVSDGEHQLGLLFEFEDVTARRLAEERVEHLATHDALTNLPNRLLLLDRLQQALNQARRYGRGVGVLFIDLDRFKIVNDSFGHTVGDELLTQVAGRLNRCARATDTVARLGGDEFVIICPDVGNDRDVLEIATHVREAVARPITVGDLSLSVDTSVGVAFGVGSDSAEQLLQDADHAMYQAKSHGRARFEVFSDGLRGRIQSRMDTELALRGAVERGEMETWFQPIVALEEQSLVACEALARWRRPEQGVVLPGDFIQVAEESGMIKSLGSTVLTQSCLAAVSEGTDWSVSVNVSARQFVDGDFGAVVETALEFSGLPPDRLWLELTESAVVDAIDSAATTFQSLRQRGVRIAIDDFGVGYSSFAHLRLFPVDLFKVDMSFVRDLGHSAGDRDLLRGMLRMAETLGLDVVVEGIETTTQRDILRDLGCRFGQGYLFGRPSPITTPMVPTQPRA